MINSSIAEIHALFIHFFTKKLFDWFKNTNQDKNFKYKISVKVIQMRIFMWILFLLFNQIKYQNTWRHFWNNNENKYIYMFIYGPGQLQLQYKSPSLKNVFNFNSISLCLQ